MAKAANKLKIKFNFRFCVRSEVLWCAPKTWKCILQNPLLNILQSLKHFDKIEKASFVKYLNFSSCKRKFFLSYVLHFSVRCVGWHFFSIQMEFRLRKSRNWNCLFLIWDNNNNISSKNNNNDNITEVFWQFPSCCDLIERNLKRNLTRRVDLVNKKV